ncbi:MAG: class I SAM-dependent methyltransferase, partial [Pseudomonadota bacterium]
MGIREQESALFNTREAQRVGQSLGISGRTRCRSVQVTAFDRWLAQQLLHVAGNPPFTLVLWDNSEVTLSSARITARLHIADRRALLRLVTDPELHFGDLYGARRLEVEGDFVQFLSTAYRAVGRARPGFPVHRLLHWLSTRPRTNSLDNSRDNIHHHYDLGNRFYALWLDEAAMQYTCAYFPDPAMSLEAAQVAKLHHVCRKLRLQPGEEVVEAGCGWGGLARFMARHYGVRVRAYNISGEQIAHARERAAQEGLSERVQYIEDDYRNISGSCDVFVSVGMLEHVGIDNYRALGEVIRRCLSPDGRGLIHTIGRRQPGKMNAWIERRIFPGACPPSLAQMMEIFEPFGFAVQDVENLRLHYARTLEHWLER